MRKKLQPGCSCCPTGGTTVSVPGCCCTSLPPTVHLTSSLSDFPTTDFVYGPLPTGYNDPGVGIGGLRWWTPGTYTDVLTGQTVKFYFACQGGTGRLVVSTAGLTGDGPPTNSQALFFCGTVNGHTNTCSPLNYIYSRVSSPNTPLSPVNSLALTLTP